VIRLSEMPRIVRSPSEESPRGFGKRDLSDVASACMIASDAGLARSTVADLLSCPVAELECRATVVTEVRP